jgi:hypothetical protein
MTGDWSKPLSPDAGQHPSAFLGYLCTCHYSWSGPGQARSGSTDFPFPSPRPWEGTVELANGRGRADKARGQVELCTSWSPSPQKGETSQDFPVPTGKDMSQERPLPSRTQIHESPGCSSQATRAQHCHSSNRDIKRGSGIMAVDSAPGLPYKTLMANLVSSRENE